MRVAKVSVNPLRSRKIYINSQQSTTEKKRKIRTTRIRNRNYNALSANRKEHP